MIVKLIEVEPRAIDAKRASNGWYKVSQQNKGTYLDPGDGLPVRSYPSYGNNDILLISNGCIANITRNFCDPVADHEARSGVVMVLPLGMTLLKLEMTMDALATNPQNYPEEQIRASAGDHQRGFEV